jgi:hypothetical protein
MNSATDYITKHRLHFQSKNLTIFDEKSIYQNYIEKLLPCFKNIKIITDSPDKYKSISRNLLEAYGFSLMVSADKTADSDVIISHNLKLPIYFEGTVFTNEKRYLMNAKVFSGSEIILPDIYESLRPDGISMLLFASALYENCKENSLREIRYKDFGC